MSTLRTFDNMLNEYLTNDLMSEALLKRDWFIQNVPKDSGWKGGAMPVPFYGTKSTSVKMGGLTASGDVSKHKYVRGEVSGYKEAWGTIRFEHGDLMDHDGKVNEKSFLKILPKQIEDHGDCMKEQMSKMLLTGPAACKVVGVAGAAGGVVVVDRIDRLSLDQKFQLKQGITQIDLYVISINLNTDEVTLSASRGGLALDLTGIAVPVAVNDKLYYDGVLVGGNVVNAFQDLKSSLLSVANGGTATLYGQNKLLFPYLQAININGVAITAANLAEEIFRGYNTIRQKARGNANTVLMSFKHMGNIMNKIEDTKGAFKVTAKDTNASLYGWTEITITSVKGTLKLVGIQEMDDDCIIYLDMEAVQYYSNGELIRKRIAPDGKQYFEERDPTNGYAYLLDTAALGELVLHAPTKCGIIYGIVYP